MTAPNVAYSPIFVYTLLSIIKPFNCTQLYTIPNDLFRARYKSVLVSGSNRIFQREVSSTLDQKYLNCVSRLPWASRELAKRSRIKELETKTNIIYVYININYNYYGDCGNNNETCDYLKFYF